MKIHSPQAPNLPFFGGKKSAENSKGRIAILIAAVLLSGGSQNRSRERVADPENNQSAEQKIQPSQPDNTSNPVSSNGQLNGKTVCGKNECVG